MTQDNHHPTFSVDVTIGFGKQVLAFLITTVTSIIVARNLGPEGKGVYSLAIMFPALAMIFISMGISYANVYLIGKKRYPIGVISGNTFCYSMAIGLSTSLICIMFIPFLTANILKGVPPRYLYMTLSLVPLLLLVENMYYIILSYRKMVAVTIFSLSRPLFYLLALVFFYYSSGLSVSRVLLAYIFGLSVSFVIGLGFFIRNGYFKGFSLGKAAFIDALSFGFKQQLGIVAQFLNHRLGIFMIAAFLAPTEVGLYSIAVLIAETIWYIPRPLGMVLYPKTAASNAEEANKFTPIVCRNTVVITFIAIAAAYALCGPVIPLLFGEKFAPSVIVLRLLLPGIFLSSIGKVLGSDLTGRGFPQYISLASFISLIGTVGFNLLFIPKFGINGAAVATSLAYAANSLIIIYLFKRTSGVSLFDTLIVKPADIVIYKRFLKLFLRRR